MADTITNKQMADYTTRRVEFVTTNKTAFARQFSNEIYAVYSYGFNYPIYVYDQETDMWFGNEDYYSSTTSRHMTQARPRVDTLTYIETATLRQIVVAGGYRQYCAARCSAA